METATQTTQSPPVQLGRPVRVHEPEYVIDAENINNQLHLQFSTALVNALDAASRGELDASAEPVLIFETTYRSLPLGQEQIQYWTAFMGDGYPETFTAFDLLASEGEEPNVKKLTDAIEAFKNVGVSCLHFLPLVGNSINPAIPLYSQVRGNKNDRNPFVIYTKNLGRIYAHVDDGHFKFHSMDGSVLTPHQQRMFSKWFSEQLSNCITPELLSTVFSNAAAEFLHRATDTTGLVKQLNTIEQVGRHITSNL